MKEKRTDRRVLRTKKMLREALIELLKEKPISKITPTELCVKADINRNTFYSHYGSTEELLHTLENSLLSKIETAVLESPDKEAIAVTCRAMRKYKDLVEVLFTDNASSNLPLQIFESANKRNFGKLSRETNSLTGNYPKMISHFTIYGGAAILQIWTANGMKEEPEEIAAFVRKLCIHGTSSMTM